MPPSQFIQALLAPYVPPLGKSEPIEDQLWFLATPPAEAQPSDDPLEQPLYKATGDWRWINNTEIKDYRDILTIEETPLYTTTVRVGWAGNREIMYMNKAWKTSRPLIPFVTELSRYKTTLRHLQGSVIPTVIGVWTTPNQINMAMALPNYAFFIEASPDMPHVLKTRVIEAYKKVVATGARLDQIRLQDFLIGADGKVTILNHHGQDRVTPSGRLVPPPLDSLTAAMNLRELKFKLDYDNARQKERDKVISLAAREYANALEETKQRLIPDYTPNWAHIDPEEDVIDPNLLIEWGKDVLPRRFVAPGVSTPVLQEHVQRFLHSVLRSNPETPTPTPLSASENADKNTTPVPIEPTMSHTPTPPDQDRNTRPSTTIPKSRPCKSATFMQQYPASYVDPSVRLNNLRAKHPPILVRDFAYEPIQPVKFGKRKFDSDADSTWSSGSNRETKRPRLISLFAPLTKLWASSQELSPTVSQ